MILRKHTILFVRDQEASTRFYEATFGLSPSLFVPGMTEFTLGTDCVLGLMPIDGAQRLLGEDIGIGTAREEIYLLVDDPETYVTRALRAGGRELLSIADRDWGDRAGYVYDLDGHIIAFARALKPTSE